MTFYISLSLVGKGKKSPLKERMEIQWKVAVASESILGYEVERGRIALGNMRGMRGKEEV